MSADRAIRELLPISRTVLPVVAAAQPGNDRGVDAASPEPLKGSSLQLAGSEDHQIEGTPAPVAGQVRLVPGLLSGHSLSISRLVKPLPPAGCQPLRCSRSPGSGTTRMRSQCPAGG